MSVIFQIKIENKGDEVLFIWKVFNSLDNPKMGITTLVIFNRFPEQIPIL